MSFPALASVVELLKPITWFPPMWAFGCGAVSSGQSVSGRWPTIVAGIALSGPLVCAASQAINDWFDRHVDAINEPNRPIPSGRIPGQWGLFIAWLWTGLSLLLGAALGKWVLLATAVGLLFAWAYSAPPLRFKQNGWVGNAAVAISYEGLAWITGAAVMIAGTLPEARILLLAGLYSAGAHGIMTLNDFKSVEGDKQMGVRSLPVLLGVKNAGRVACAFMALAQVIVILFLLAWNRPVHAGIVALLLMVQLVLMTRLLESPRERAPWYGGTGVTLYVLGMLVSAFALRPAAGNI
jgi:chlorophyll/bacteriochlorophyll a synthase